MFLFSSTGHRTREPRIEQRSIIMDYISEEKKVALTGDSSAVSVQNVSDAESAGWDRKATRKLLWKMDRNIIPFMSLIYL